MHTRRAATVGLSLAVAGGLIILDTWPCPAPLDVRVIKTETAQMIDDTGGEMVLVTLLFSMPTRGSWVYVKSGAKVEAQLAGHWKRLDDTLSLGSWHGGQTRQEMILMPASAGRGRILLRYGGESILERLESWLWRRGVKLPARYWAWAGRPEGRHRFWKSFSIEFSVEPNSGTGRASDGAQNVAGVSRRWGRPFRYPGSPGGVGGSSASTLALFERYGAEYPSAGA
jgi:hypothetical protein